MTDGRESLTRKDGALCVQKVRGPTCSVRRYDAEPYTTEDLDLPSVPAGTFSTRPPSRTATSSGRVEAGAGGLGRVAQEILG